MNLYQLSDELRAFVNTQMRIHENNSREMHKAFQIWKHINLRTKTNKNRYPKRYELTLNIVYHSIVKQLENELIIFGYWFEGEFYTTYKKSKWKNTDILHDLKLPQTTWNRMFNGLYYEKSLNPYFVD